MQLRWVQLDAKQVDGSLACCGHFVSQIYWTHYGPLQAALLHSEVHVSQALIAGKHAVALQPADVQLFWVQV